MPFDNTVTGNNAAAYVGYAMSDVSTLFPITPSSPMGEAVDTWASQGRKNCFGQVLKVMQMQSEGGAAGAIHGIVAAGSLATTFTSSQGLLLMVPDMYRIAGCLYPCVIHIAARAVSTQGWSIHGDHSDVQAVRQTGFAILSSHNVQQVHDLALLAHIATLRSSIPFTHFFEGFQLSHQVSKIEMLSYDEMKPLIPMDKIYEHRAKGLNPNHPTIRGSIQSNDYYMQSVERNSVFWEEAIDEIEKVFVDVCKVLGREYKFFNYFGASDATHVMVLMGASSEIARETVNYLLEKNPNAKIGVVAIHLYRPWSLKHFLAALPKTTKRIVAMDRNIEPGSLAEPLFLDVMGSVHESQRDIRVYGGRFGLGNKHFDPVDVKSVFDNIALDTPINHFTVGINDDILHRSLPRGPYFCSVPEGMTQCIFWGLGADGTVSGNIEAIKIIGMNTDLYANGHFEFDSHKSGGVTRSFLRFGPKFITSHYNVYDDADVVACSNSRFIFKFDVIQAIKEKGIFILNTHVKDLEEVSNFIPGSLKKQIAEKHVNFYVIDAYKIAEDVGLGNKISMVMQSAFFALSGVLPLETAVPMLRKAVQAAFGKKGQKVIDMNFNAIDIGLKSYKKVEYPRDQWLSGKSDPVTVLRITDDAPDFVKNVMEPVSAMKGDDLPLSIIEPGGVIKSSTSKYEKRGIALKVPVWLPDACTQCNLCATLCPHAAIRPFLLTTDEDEKAPSNMETIRGKGVAAGYQYRIQVSPYDCTGCTLCVNQCEDNALKMVDANDVMSVEDANWDFLMKNLPMNRGAEIGHRLELKGSQFYQPLLEFSGACEGCGETQYAKLLTQMFGERMLLAKSAGCSVVWAGSFPSVSYSVNEEGKGPSYGFSLFEDNAEYGLGMYLANKQARGLLVDLVQEVISSTDIPASSELKQAMTEWFGVRDDAVKVKLPGDKLIKLLEAEYKKHTTLTRIYHLRNVVYKISQWIVGGDGWAYDIGFGGLEHVLSQGENVNVLVVDNEVYSNTGGQKSKGTPMGAVAKFAAKGKPQHKKDLGLMIMSKGDVYVASVSIAANPQQTMKAFIEAESFDGPSLIIAYAPCIEHGMQGGLGEHHEQSKLAVESGYWNLYRFDPRLEEEGKNPFQLDSKRVKEDIMKFIRRENRFQRLNRTFPDVAHHYQECLADHVKERHQKLRNLEDSFSVLKAELVAVDMTVIYASESGNAEGVAKAIAHDGTVRGMTTKCMECDALEVDDLKNGGKIIVVASTAGQGEIPDNGKTLYNDLLKYEGSLVGVSYAVFGLGDSSYVFFNKAAELYDQRLEKLGATRLMEMGKGDDLADDTYLTALEEWEPEMWSLVGAQQPVSGPPKASHIVTVRSDSTRDPKDMKGLHPRLQPELKGTWSVHDLLAPQVDKAIPDAGAGYKPKGATLIKMTKNVLLTPPDHDRDIRHYEFDLTDSGIKYGAGDSLAIWPKNNEKRVIKFLEEHWDLEPNDVIMIENATDEDDVSEFPQQLTALELFRDVLDIFGRPSRMFLRSLAHFASNADEKKELEQLTQKDGKKAYKDTFSSKLYTYADILGHFKSALPPLDVFMDLIPKIKPRCYSIASSSQVDANKIELCIVLVDFKGGEKQEDRFGLCTDYLRNLDPKKGEVPIMCKIQFGTFELPKRLETPLIMAGLGTGMAPFRGIVQQRQHLKKLGKDCGPLSLYYGCRFEKKEFLYGDWLREQDKAGVLRVRPAFSRDQNFKVYVTDKLKEDAEIIFDELVNKGGHFLYCGPSGRQPDDIRKAIVHALVTVGKLEQEKAEAMLLKWRISGKYTEETW